MKFLPILNKIKIEKVENIPHTGDDNPPYPHTAWLRYWENQTHQYNCFCSNFLCFKRATLGGHIKTIGNNTAYIIPLCDSCNKLEKPFYKRIGSVLVTVPSD